MTAARALGAPPPLRWFVAVLAEGGKRGRRVREVVIRARDRAAALDSVRAFARDGGMLKWSIRCDEIVGGLEP